MTALEQQMKKERIQVHHIYMYDDTNNIRYMSAIDCTMNNVYIVYTYRRRDSA